MTNQVKIHKIILSDSLEISGLGQFQGQEVEIIITPITQSSYTPLPSPSINFMRFAGIAADETALLEDLEKDISANRDLDLQKLDDL
jgi:hypothetical protein